MAGAMKLETYEAGDRIINYGDQGLTYYIMSKGNVKVTVYQPGVDAKDPDLEDKKLITKEMSGAGQGFGELALLYNDKRSASIEAIDTCEVYALSGPVFQAITIQSSIQKRTRLAGFLDQIPLLDQLDKF